jgi:hypothetical protein
MIYINFLEKNEKGSRALIKNTGSLEVGIFGVHIN